MYGVEGRWWYLQTPEDLQARCKTEWIQNYSEVMARETSGSRMTKSEIWRKNGEDLYTSLVKSLFNRYLVPSYTESKIIPKFFDCQYLDIAAIMPSLCYGSLGMSRKVWVCSCSVVGKGDLKHCREYRI